MNNTFSQYKITDTIYYDHQWEICEKPLATYYRTGILAALNDRWYYTGIIKDYTMSNTLISEGTYSDEGTREGDFTFYYPDGKIMAVGKYQNSKPVGNWTWYYPDGKEEAVILFTANEDEFQFVKFIDKDGQTTLENGTGDFSWYSDPLEWVHAAHTCSGSFKNGKRAGNWHFDVVNKKENIVSGFTEKYNNNGKYTGITYDDFKRPYIGTKAMRFQFTPRRIHLTENILYDDLFKLNGDSLAISALTYYLIEHKPTEINLRYKVYDTAYATIMRALERYQYKIHFNQNRNIDSKIEFKIGAKGYLEDISFTGTGLDSSEKVFFPFLLSKFKYVEMPGTGSVAIETNYTVYCFSIDFAKVIPGNTENMFTKRLFFSFQPRNKFEGYLKEHEKEIKEDFIHNMRYIHSYRRN
ncbi:MAG: hypothetical protein ABIN36_15125 [Ferruginibacter sp.]